MEAFDTDILTQILRGNPDFAKRIALLPEQSLPILFAEELIRGRLNSIRQAETVKAKITIDRAYHFFEQTLKEIGMSTPHPLFLRLRGRHALRHSSRSV